MQPFWHRPSSTACHLPPARAAALSDIRLSDEYQFLPARPDEASDNGQVSERKPIPRNGNPGTVIMMWSVCLPLAWFFGHLIYDIPVRNAQVVLAGLDLAGDQGTVTVTRSERVYEGGGRGGGHRTTHCFGEFSPPHGSERLLDIRVHVDGECDAGRVVPARLVRADPANWIDGNDEDHAYAGAGWGSALFVGLFMGAFLLLVGGIPIVCVVLFPLMLLQRLWSGRGRTT